ncbi:hypothetical protein GQX73_g1894 [Xylaria multiplex]|uniref:ATP-dependent DNA helicase II subunit 1 n=1 Tax=Xylaria multiplex TaxID=323545 RepID=A0A7C8J1M9_9PEZI|nr:hypothetical protein GQX73_g1894 [Xylaria multiplex]
MADRWSYERRDEEDEEDEEDEFTEGHYKAQKDALIFAIQVSESMLQAPPKSEDKKASRDSAVLTALKCAYQVMQQRIISNPKDMIGIILFGTKKSKVTDTKLPDPNCYLLTDLEVPAADDVRALRDLVEEGEGTDEILAPSKQPADMVIDPLLDEANPGKVAPAKSGDGLDLLQSLISNINSRQTPKRAYFSGMPFEIGPGLTISVKGYNIIQKQAPARSCYIWLEGETPQVAVGETARLAEDSARTVENFEVKKAYKFGSEYVYFTDEEQKSIKQFGGTCIRIIGFKDRSLLRFWASIKKSTYIFPSEEGYVGSTRVFTALWQKLLKSKKVGVAWHIARKNGNPQLVAIIPSRVPSDEKSGTQYIPAGLWLYPIPFIDDVRDGPETREIVRTTNALTDRMNKVVQQLQLPGGAYNPSKYPNPALQWHYKILQALALEDVVPDQPEDATVPKYRAIHKRCGGYIQEWSRVAEDVLGQMQEQRKIKRELEQDNEEDEPRPAKKPRSTATKDKSTGEDGVSNRELRQRYDAGTLTKLTVVELRSVLSGRGLDTKGVKKDLVERLEQWVEDNHRVPTNTRSSLPVVSPPPAISSFTGLPVRPTRLLKRDEAGDPAAVVGKMDALGLSASRPNVACSSVEDLQGQLHQLLAAKTTDTRAERISPNFELLSNVIFHLPADVENGTDPGLVQSQQLPIARTVLASETVQSQPTDDPILQKSVAKHISNAIGAVDNSAWTVRQVTRGAQGWQFTYICKDSLQAWNRVNAKNPDRPVIGSYSGTGGLDPINISRPAFDCRGTLTIAFSKSSRGIVVKYEHTPLHKTVGQLVEQLVPTPIPVSSGNHGSQRTPKTKRPRLVDGEEGSRKKKTPKARPLPTDGEEGSHKKRTAKTKRPLLVEGEDGSSSKKRRRISKPPDANVRVLEDGQNRPQTQAPLNSTGEKPGSTGFLNVPPAEAERRRQTAIDLLSGKGIDPATLSSEQFNIFANQAPNLQAASLDMLAKYGAERLRIVHPDEKEQAGSSNPIPTIGQTANSTPETAAELPPGSTSNGAVVPLEQDGELGTTESALKPRAARGRKTRGRCDTCKQRDVPCTKEHPSCSVCIDAGVDCVYLPPKPRRKSEKLAESPKQEDSIIPGDDDHVQHETENKEQASAPGPPVSQTITTLQAPPDLENEEFIPDPNILSGPVEHQTASTQSINASEYYQHAQNGIDFSQTSNVQTTVERGAASIPSFTYPQSRTDENTSQPTVAFPPTLTQPPQSHSLPGLQASSISSQQHTQSASLSSIQLEFFAINTSLYKCLSKGGTPTSH